MSSIFNPLGSLVSAVTPTKNFTVIESSTNAAPIVIQTFASHGFNNGDFVEVNNHLVNTNANGIWTVTVIDSTHFSLNGSGGNGVGVNTGFAKDYSLLPVLQVPGDGDLASAANLVAPIEGIACYAPWINRQTGTYRFFQWYSATFGDINPIGSAAPLWSTTSTTSTTYVNCSFATALLNPNPVMAVGINDILFVTAFFQAYAGSVSASMVTLGMSTNGGSYGDLSGQLSAVYLRH